MNTPLIVIFAAVCLDAVGIGLIFPILPSLLRDVTHMEDVASWIGLLSALYAVMQFFFAPGLGALSDRLGRRPMLLISMAGAAASYLFLASASSLWMLLIGRAIAGVTSANISVATAYITDISPETTRARRFGVFNAMFGLGFIIGPVAGGMLGDYWLRLPFVVAGVLNACTLLLAFFLLPESHVPNDGPADLAAVNPLRPLLWVLSMKRTLPVILIFFLFSATGEAYGACWALWGMDAFGWNGLWIGLSLGAFGVCQSLSQAFLPGPAVRWLGERAAVLTGIAAVSLALIVMALARESWLIFAIMPLFALGGIGAPALQSLASQQVDDSRQGQFQGVVASVVSLASIVSPRIFSSIYMMVRAQWPGSIWLLVALVYAASIPLVVRLPSRKRGTVFVAQRK